MRHFIAYFLFILAAWTLVIKFIFPAAYALAQGMPFETYVMWDFWWVVHIALGWSLLRWGRYTYAFAMVVSLAEIAIIGSKFAIFLSDPQWTIWRTNWFINKLFVLACFVLLLGYLLVLARGRQGWGAAPPRDRWIRRLGSGL